MIPLARAIGIDFGSGGTDWASYWAKQTDVFLFFGQIKNISGGQLPNEMTGSSDALTVTGAAGSYTFQCPNTAPYIAADTDYIWFKTDETQRTPTEAELVGYDFPRTLVKYDDDDPYSIRWIAILKSGVILTADQLNDLHKSFYLHTLWTGVINGYGHIKGNKLDQTLWTPEAVYTYFDSFTDDDDTQVSAHTPDSNNFAWSTYGVYVPIITSNKLLPSHYSSFNVCFHDTGSADVDISVTLNIPVTDGSINGFILLRGSSNGSLRLRVGYRRAEGESATIIIYKDTTILTSAEVTHITGDNILRVVASGNFITVCLRGVKIVDNYETTEYNTATRHGLVLYRYLSGGAAISMDNYTIL